MSLWRAGRLNCFRDRNKDLRCPRGLLHPLDQNQLWANEWDDDQRLLRTITTPRVIAVRLLDAQKSGQRVFVHRCSWSGVPAEICCSALVESISDIDKATVLVRFAAARPISARPAATPHLGQNWYEGDVIPDVSRLICAAHRITRGRDVCACGFADTRLPVVNRRQAERLLRSL
jgi:hypothetical protein